MRNYRKIALYVEFDHSYDLEKCGLPRAEDCWFSSFSVLVNLDFKVIQIDQIFKFFLEIYTQLLLKVLSRSTLQKSTSNWICWKLFLINEKMDHKAWYTVKKLKGISLKDHLNWGRKANFLDFRLKFALNKVKAHLKVLKLC